MAEKNYNSPPKQVKEPGPIGKTFNFFTKIISVMFFSLLASVVIEWIGMSYWWEEPGYTHAEKLLAQEIEHLNTDFKESVLSSSPVEFVEATAGAASSYVFKESGFTSFLVSLKEYSTERGIMGGVSRFYLGIESYVLAAIIITQVFFVRLSILTLSMPLFLLIAVIGTAEGLMQRDLRRWGGGREFGFVYHRAKRMAIPAFLFTWIFYLAMPFSIHPNAILLPFAIFFGLIIYTGTSRFKKYL